MTHVELEILQDGKSIPGFPFRAGYNFRRLIRVVNSYTNTGAFANLLPTLEPAATYKIGMLAFTPDRGCIVALRDAYPNPLNPFTLGADRMIVILGGNIDQSSAAPFAIVKPTSSPTLITTWVGIL